MFSVIFPGQGSQIVGMGKEFFDKYNVVKNLFNEEDLRLFDSKQISFFCTCSKDKMEQSIINLGKEEAFKILQDHGYKVGIITTEDMNLNRRRAKKLDLDFDFHGAEDKLHVVEELCREENITIDQVAYIGDDINCFSLLFIYYERL